MNIEDYTQALVEEDGTFRMFPLSWTLEESEKTGSVCLAIRFGISRKWHGKEAGWSEEYAPGWYTEHRAWILVRPKKDGKPIDGASPVLSEKTVKRLSECGLWNGDFDLIESAPPAVFVLGDVSGEEYEGRVRHRCDWVNPDAAEPRARGSFAPVDRGLLDRLRATHQAKARALTAPAPGSAPAAPAPPASPVASSGGSAVVVEPANSAPLEGTPAPVNPVAEQLAAAVQPAAPAPAQAAPTAAPAGQAPQSAQPPAWGGAPAQAAPGAALAAGPVPVTPQAAAPPSQQPPTAGDPGTGAGEDKPPF